LYPKKCGCVSSAKSSYLGPVFNFSWSSGSRTQKVIKNLPKHFSTVLTRNVGIEDDNMGETEKNTDSSKFARAILDKLEMISTEQKNNQEINMTRFESLDQ